MEKGTMLKMLESQSAEIGTSRIVSYLPWTEL